MATVRLFLLTCRTQPANILLPGRHPPVPLNSPSNSNTVNPTSLYSEELVLRVNELFHDHATRVYTDIHEVMTGKGEERWRRLAARFLPPSPVVLADIGTGMGLVPLTIGPLLKEGDRVLLSDISQGMLDAAQENIERAGFPWSAEYLKLSGTVPLTLPFADRSVNVITMNSVLHHIKDTGRFIAEVDRILKPGGIFVVAHEPNVLFRRRKILWRGYKLIYPIINPKYALRSRPARALGIYKLVMAIYFRLRPDRGAAGRSMLEEMNAQLRREGLITQPLGLDEIGEITDIHDAEGFDPLGLVPGYEVVHLETYNHIGQVSIDNAQNRVISRYENWLRRRYPTEGCTFFLILRKPSTPTDGR